MSVHTYSIKQTLNDVKHFIDSILNNIKKLLDDIYSFLYN